MQMRYFMNIFYDPDYFHGLAGEPQGFSQGITKTKVFHGGTFCQDDAGGLLQTIFWITFNKPIREELEKILISKNHLLVISFIARFEGELLRMDTYCIFHPFNF